MDGETAFLALAQIKQQCTGKDGTLDEVRYKAAVQHLIQHTKGAGAPPSQSTPPSTQPRPQGASK